MAIPVTVLTDYTEPSGEGSDILSRFDYEVKGVENTRELIRFFPVKPGLALSITDSGYAKVSSSEYETLNAPVTFSFILSGQAVQQVQGMPKRKNFKVDLNPGRCIINAMPRTRGRVTIPPQKAFTVVELKMDRSLLYTCIKDSMDRVPREIIDILNPDKQVCLSRPLSSRTTDLLVQIINPPAYHAGVMPLFYESRALDLLAVQLENLCLPEKTGEIFILNASDIERIHEARRILLESLCEPPTISGLARTCGINEFKLKKGFKQTFNMTIFGFLRQQKMKTARQLIQNEHHCVTRAASEVGYTNVSHFIKAFKKEFGLNPGQLKKAAKFKEPGIDQ